MPANQDTPWLREGKLVLGMIHLQALPGTPYHRDGSFPEILHTAVQSARTLQDGGADGCLIQTVDRVYAADESSDPARIAALSLITRAVVEATGPGFQVGAQLMRNAICSSLAVVKVAGGCFTRATALVGATMSPSGLVHADPLTVMDYRKKIDAQDVKIVAEVASMHFSWFGGGKTVAEVAASARQAGADAVSLCHADDDTTLEMIAAVRATCPELPIILAGHTHHGNAGRLLGSRQGADGAFVGTCLESAGWGSAIDSGKVKSYVEAIHTSRD
ncbi:BtpA/SgcQ family protein [Nonomuraea endophytica]|uniref:BtpA/SgcQ family protein n=1 Tax=Nonomuraea endophytica TaxID=714136 RepID=UPI0037C52BBA